MDGSCVPVGEEKSNDYGDGGCDSDLEARLYAEIYYSNDTHAENTVTAEPTNDESPATVRSIATLSSIPTINDIRVNSIPQSRNKDSAFRRLPANTVKNFEHPNISRVFARRQRQLTLTNLWSVPKDVNTNTPLAREPPSVPSENARVPVAREHASNLPEFTGQSATLKSKKKARILKQNRIPTRQFSGTRKLRRRKDASDCGQSSLETGKYNIVDKREKSKMRETRVASVEISSDSDDSILELPIPSKAQPPIIQLSDSNDDGDSSTDDESADRVVRDEGESEMCRYVEARLTEETRERSPREPGRLESPLGLDGNHGGSTTDAISSTMESRGSASTDVTENRISSPIGWIDTRQNTLKPTRDSSGMLENDMSNERSVSGQNNNASDGEIRSIDEFISNSCVSAQSHSTTNNSTEAANANKVFRPPSEKITTNGITAVVENDADNLIINCTGVQTGTSNRKRMKNVNLRKFTGVPEIALKRSKESADKSSLEISSTEYFFKPMSKELQAFYNNPWGGENLDLYDIQSRMPKNPRFWVISDADLQPSPKRRARECPFCRMIAYSGHRCPKKNREPCCCMCGDRGHVETRCPQTMCLTCGQKYTTFRPTCTHCSKLFCNMCHGIGHTEANCPDLWRRYHDTTTETLPIPKDLGNIMKPHRNLSCCNCAKRGHDSTMCKQLRWSPHFPTPIYVSNYTDGPVYPPSRQDRAPRINPSRLIGIVEPSFQGDITSMNSPSALSEGSLLFGCGNYDFSKAICYHNITDRLDIIGNVHLEGFLAGDLKPDFLNAWQRHFIFNVRVIRNPNQHILLTIEAGSKQRVCGLEKLLLQWFTRTDVEKAYLVYDGLPYDDINQMSKKLARKVLLLRNVLEPTKLLRKIRACEQTIEQTMANLTCKTPQVGKVAKRTAMVNHLMQNILKRRSELVTSVYSGSWVEGSETMVQSFRTLAGQIKWSRDCMAIQDYMEIVYLYNELFTIHESDAITRAIARAKSGRPSSKSNSPSLAQSSRTPVESDSTNLHHEIIDNPGESSLPVELENQRPIEPDNFDKSSCSLVVRQTLLSTEPLGTATLNAAAVPDNNCHNEPPISCEPPELETISVPPSRQGPVLDPCDKKQQQSAKKKKKVNPNDLIVSLTRKKRKFFRRSARAAIKLACSKENDDLRNIANQVHSKMTDGSFRVNDVLLLQQAIAERSKKKQRKKRQPRKS